MEDIFFTIYFIVLAFILGSVFGSFINCMAWRIVHGESVIKGRSHCAVCNHPLSALDLVPIFSWLFLKGKCRYCGEKISPRYMIVELICAMAFTGVVIRFGLSGDLVRYLVLVCILLGLSLVDLDSYKIPDGFIISMIVLFALTLPLSSGSIKTQLIGGLEGAVLLGGGLLAISLIFDKLTGKESLGGGDIKLFFAAGLYLGPLKGLMCLILSCIVGLIASAAAKKNRIPFGPSISIAVYLTILFGDMAAAWYLGLFM